MVEGLLVVYLYLVGCMSAGYLICFFPDTSASPIVFIGGLSNDQGFMLIALFSGICGSFLHAAQSLSSYLGNQKFIASWAVWFLVRPIIGGILALAIFLTLKAGLLGTIDAVNPYGVTAISLLGGWFSKTTTDKLQEVFEVLFKTNADSQRVNKLK